MRARRHGAGLLQALIAQLFMADAVGATGKPLIRVHTAGSVGGSTGAVAASLVKSRQVPARDRDGLGEAVRVECHVGVEHSQVRFTKPVRDRVGVYFAPHVRAYIRRSGAPTHIGAMVGGSQTSLTAPRTRWRICISPTSRWTR